jgi:hypothetical protein
MTLSSSPSTEGRLMVQLFKFNRDSKIVIYGARRDDKMMGGVREMGMVTHRNNPYGITIPLFSLS